MRYDIVGASEIETENGSVSGTLTLRRRTTAPRFAGLASAAFAALLLTPFIAIGWAAATEGDIVDTVLGNAPSDTLATILLACAALLAIGLFGWGLVRVMSCHQHQREVSFARTDIHVTDRTGARSTQWCEPISAYRGVAHRVRTSLSGSRHELWLVHADKKKSFPLTIATMLGETEIATRARHLGLNVVPFGQPTVQNTSSGDASAAGLFKPTASALAART